MSTKLLFSSSTQSKLLNTVIKFDDNLRDFSFQIWTYFHFNDVFEDILNNEEYVLLFTHRSLPYNIILLAEYII